MRVYLDASAAVKLIRDERESDALSQFLQQLTEPLAVVSSMLVETELRRMAVRDGMPQEAVSRALRKMSLIELDRDHFRAAGLLPDRGLRSLDALHLVSAMQADADVLVAYETRLLQAARTVGMRTTSPT